MVIVISGYEVLIDDEDYKRIREYKYNLNKVKAKKQGQFYFERRVSITEHTTLHRDIMYCTKGDGKIVDHINRNTLDNRKNNLRICTNAENLRNSKTYKNNSSGIKGVCWRNTTKKWRAQIQVDGKVLHLGYFTNTIDAANAYAEASKKYHGEFGRTK